MNAQSPIVELYYQRHAWDFRLGTYLGLLRTMGIAGMVSRLYAGSLLQSETFQRLQRTRELIKTLILEGLDSEAGRAALDRMATKHRGVTATNDEYRYVLSVFFLEPLRFNQHFGAQPFSQRDRDLLLDFWLQVGARMGIADLVPSLHEWMRFQADFEAAHQGPTPAGHALARTSLYEVNRLVIPRGMQGLTRQILLGTMDGKVRTVLGLPEPRVPTTVSLSLLRLATLAGLGTRTPEVDRAARA
ncbi:MAG: oxygenase MpaB family protein [Myxococcales bacterium]